MEGGEAVSKTPAPQLADDSIMVAYEVICSLQLSAQDPEIVLKAQRIFNAKLDFEREIAARREAAIPQPAE